MPELVLQTALLSSSTSQQPPRATNSRIPAQLSAPLTQCAHASYKLRSASAPKSRDHDGGIRHGAASVRRLSAGEPPNRRPNRRRRYCTALPLTNARADRQRRRARYGVMHVRLHGVRTDGVGQPSPPAEGWSCKSWLAHVARWIPSCTFSPRFTNANSATCGPRRLVGAWRARTFVLLVRTRALCARGAHEGRCAAVAQPVLQGRTRRGLRLC
jgi:hypothetical protein